MDQVFAILPSGNPNDYRCIMAEAVTPNSPVQTIDVPAPHSIAQDVHFIGLNNVSHYFYCYELIGGVLGALLTPPYLVQPKSQSLQANPDIELLVTDVPTEDPNKDIVAPDQDTYDGSTKFPQLVGLVAGVDYMITQRGIATLKYEEFVDINEGGEPLLFGFKLTNSNIFNVDDTFFIRFLPKIVITTNNNSSSGGSYIDILSITSNTILSSIHIKKLIDVNSDTDKITLTLDALENVADMAFIGFKTDRGNQINAVIKAADGELIYHDGAEVNDVVMGRAEHLKLIKKSTRWHVELFDGDHGKVGSVDFGYRIGRNQVVGQGDTVARDVYVRAWRLVESLAPGIGVTDDTSWLADPLKAGMFSYGDGVETFRFPDLRGLFPRWLPLAKTTIDADRTSGGKSIVVGDIEADAFKAHTHSHKRPRTDSVGTRYESNTLREDNDRGLWTGDDVTTGSTGGTETRGINVGFLPLINI